MIVLEARARVGGRNLDRALPGGHPDLLGLELDVEFVLDGGHPVGVLSRSDLLTFLASKAAG